MAKRSFYVKDSELDDYQVKVINKRTDNSYIVKGCAGSGKSILALWKAKQIQEQGKGSYLYVVYTKALKRYMSDGIKQIGLRESNVANFDACFMWGRGDDGILTRGSWKKGSYDYIIVDEAQDFSEEDILLLKSKTKMEDIQYFTKFPVEQLVFNHRLPKKIARVAEYLNSDHDDLEDRCTEEGSEKPKILQYNSKREQFAAIAELIKNKGMEDVGILFRNNNDVDEAYDYFSKHGIQVEAKSYKHKDELNFTSDNPKLMTYHSSKGLQFENVFIPECTAYGVDDRNPLYVAITRTYKALYIMHSGNLSTFFDDVPTSLYDNSLTVGETLTL